MGFDVGINLGGLYDVHVGRKLQNKSPQSSFSQTDKSYFSIVIGLFTSYWIFFWDVIAPNFSNLNIINERFLIISFF